MVTKHDNIAVKHIYQQMLPLSHSVVMCKTHPVLFIRPLPRMSIEVICQIQLLHVLDLVSARKYRSVYGYKCCEL